SESTIHQVEGTQNTPEGASQEMLIRAHGTLKTGSSRSRRRLLTPEEFDGDIASTSSTQKKKKRNRENQDPAEDSGPPMSLLLQEGSRCRQHRGYRTLP
ncbi:hypothetical protein JOQ06_023538, partial [Pogonophryne albipinna]